MFLMYLEAVLVQELVFLILQLEQPLLFLPFPLRLQPGLLLLLQGQRILRRFALERND